MAKGPKSPLTDGLKITAPPASDASTKPQGGSVNSDTTRSTVGKAAPTIGPRTA